MESLKLDLAYKLRVRFRWLYASRSMGTLLRRLAALLCGGPQ
jgi:hypothetical protein